MTSKEARRARFPFERGVPGWNVDFLFVEPIGRDEENLVKESLREQRLRYLIQATREAAHYEMKGNPVPGSMVT